MPRRPRDELKFARSRAELIRTYIAAGNFIVACCSLGILLAHYVLGWI